LLQNNYVLNVGLMSVTIQMCPDLCL